MNHAPAPPHRNLRVHRDRGHTVLELHGEIDILTALAIAPYLDSATHPPEPRVVIDLRPVEFFDCSGLRLLYRARSRVLARGGSLHLVCDRPLTLRMLTVTGLDRVLPPSATLDEVLERTETASGTL